MDVILFLLFTQLVHSLNVQQNCSWEKVRPSAVRWEETPNLWSPGTGMEKRLFCLPTQAGSMLGNTQSVPWDIKYRKTLQWKSKLLHTMVGWNIYFFYSIVLPVEWRTTTSNYNHSAISQCLFLQEPTTGADIFCWLCYCFRSFTGCKEETTGNFFQCRIGEQQRRQDGQRQFFTCQLASQCKRKENTNCSHPYICTCHAGLCCSLKLGGHLYSYVYSI